MNDEFEKFFIENDFDSRELIEGHETRFLRKLKNKKKTNSSWKWLGAVAVVLLSIVFFAGKNYHTKNYDLKNVSGEMAEVQSFFTSSIKHELKTVEKYKSSENQELIVSALKHVEKLDQEYQSLKKELKTADNNKVVIESMIKNYQKRLEILQDLLVKIREIEKNTNFKKERNEYI